MQVEDGMETQAAVARIAEHGTANGAGIWRGLWNLLSSYRIRIGQIAIGHTFLLTTNFLFDNVLYFYVLHRLGLVSGGIVMTLLSLITCLGMLVFYEWSKTDWLGFNALERVKEKGAEWVTRFEQGGSRLSRWLAFVPSRIFLFVLWSLQKGDIVAFFALSAYQDPFITTVYLRHGRFDGLRQRDWMIFFGSVVVSNACWILFCFGILESVKAIGEWF